MAGSCWFSLLGRFEVQIDGRGISSSAWKHRRGADLVKLLALSPGHRLHRERCRAAAESADSDSIPGNGSGTPAR